MIESESDDESMRYVHKSIIACNLSYEIGHMSAITISVLCLY